MDAHTSHTTQYMILSLPSTGSDWLADVVCQVHPHLRYYKKEFFNPLLNLRHASKLEHGFGSELVSSYRQFGIPWETRPEALAKVYDATWTSAGYDFDKEVFSAFNVGFFAQRFKTVVLYRNWRQTFPPRRLRVLQWYEAMCLSILESRHLLQPRLQAMAGFALKYADTLTKKVAAAHAMATARMITDAQKSGVPVLDHAELMQLPEADLSDYLQDRLPGEWDAARIAGIAVKTRRVEPRSNEHAWQWAGVPEFYRGISAAGGYEALLGETNGTAWLTEALTAGTGTRGRPIAAPAAAVAGRA